MLKELWARMRGADRGPEVQATVRSVLRYEEPSARGRYVFSRRLADVTFAYMDTRQEHQYGSITVEDSSSLYDAKEDDTFMIRLNPAHPERYYSPETTRSYL
jgi:hypothetical protein